MIYEAKQLADDFEQYSEFFPLQNLDRKLEDTFGSWNTNEKLLSEFFAKCFALGWELTIKKAYGIHYVTIHLQNADEPAVGAAPALHTATAIAMVWAIRKHQKQQM